MPRRKKKATEMTDAELERRVFPKKALEACKKLSDSKAQSVVSKASISLILQVGKPLAAKSVSWTGGRFAMNIGAIASRVLMAVTMIMRASARLSAEGIVRPVSGRNFFLMWC